jgi:hypothetical protein
VARERERAQPARASIGAVARERRLLADVTREIERVLASVTELGQAMAGLWGAAEAGGRALYRENLLELRPLVADVLRRHEGFAAGAGVVLAPGVLADAPRCIEWWWADRGSGLERLEVDLDPDSVEFYDYTTEDWYREPERTGEASVAGPYVDYICTHEYTFTLSVGLVLAGRFIGVAGADILAAQVEQAVVPGLSRLGRVAVLAGGNGRVIASNSVSFLPGTVLARANASAELVAVAGPGSRGPSRASSLPWTLLEGDELSASSERARLPSSA